MIEMKLFNTIVELHKNKKLGNKLRYQLALASLDILNEKYFIERGTYFMQPIDIIEYYSKLWEF